MDRTTGPRDPVETKGAASKHGEVPPHKPAFTSDNLAALFECPVCRDYALPPIQQCENGHLVCSSCKTKTPRCPICRRPRGKAIRNLAMDKLAHMISFPCKYRLTGCSTVLPLSAKLKHEKVCEYGPCPCLLGHDACKWEGELTQLKQHVVASHKFIPILQGDTTNISANIFKIDVFCWLAILRCFERDFVVVLKKEASPHIQYFANVRLIGSSNDAQLFAYQLQLPGHNERLTRRALTRTIHPSGDSTADADGLSFDLCKAVCLAQGSNLSVDVAIRRL